MTTVRTISAVCIAAVLLGLVSCPADAVARSQGSVGSARSDPRILCFTELQGNAAPVAQAYVALFADAEHSDCDVINPGGFYPFTMWVWWLPSETGMRAAEFAISYPVNVIGTTVTPNSPSIVLSLGDLVGGISVAFGECQTEWTWSHQQVCYLMNTQVSHLELVANPDAGAYQIATCELGFPIVPVTRLTHLWLNASCGCPPPQLPKLVGVNVRGNAAIRATFDICVNAGMPPWYFVLHNKADAADSINVILATRVNEDSYDLALEEAMVDSTTYILVTKSSIWSCSEGYYSRSQIEFIFLEATATETSSWGAIKALFGR